MGQSPTKFKELLEKSINQIHARSRKAKLIVRDELGYVAGREGRTAMDYWCRGEGHIPDAPTVEKLAREIIKQSGFNKEELKLFLLSADYTNWENLCDELFPLNSDLKVAQTIPSILSAYESHRLVSVNKKTPLWAFIAGALLMILLFVTLALNSINGKPIATPQPVMIKLVGQNQQQLIITATSRTISSGDEVQSGEKLTVTFKIMNYDARSVTIKSLVAGARGPGVGCNQSKKWTSAQDVSFPLATNILLQPGQEYEYREGRIFYEEGTYFIEPVFEDMPNHWNGILPFTCIDFLVIK